MRQADVQVDVEKIREQVTDAREGQVEIDVQYFAQVEKQRGHVQFGELQPDLEHQHAQRYVRQQVLELDQTLQVQAHGRQIEAGNGAQTDVGYQVEIEARQADGRYPELDQPGQIQPLEQVDVQLGNAEMRHRHAGDRRQFFLAILGVLGQRLGVLDPALGLELGTAEHGTQRFLAFTLDVHEGRLQFYLFFEGDWHDGTSLKVKSEGGLAAGCMRVRLR